MKIELFGHPLNPRALGTFPVFKSAKFYPKRASRGPATAVVVEILAAQCREVLHCGF